MKKIINGKLYQTDKAKMVGSWDNGYYTNDFRFSEETLYIKKTGEYFLHCEGGALSPYAEKIGDNTGYGEEIRPMSYDEAREWAEEKLSADEYEAEFGEVDEEDTSKERLVIYIQKKNLEKLKVLAAKEGVNTSKLMNKIIENL